MPIGSGNQQWVDPCRDESRRWRAALLLGLPSVLWAALRVRHRSTLPWAARRATTRYQQPDDAYRPDPPAYEDPPLTQRSARRRVRADAAPLRSLRPEPAADDRPIARRAAAAIAARPSAGPALSATAGPATASQPSPDRATASPTSLVTTQQRLRPAVHAAHGQAYNDPTDDGLRSATGAMTGTGPATTTRQAGDSYSITRDSRRPATASSARSARASPASSSTPSRSRAAPTATSWARTRAAPSLPACATARARSTPKMPAPIACTGRDRRSATTPAPKAPRSWCWSTICATRRRSISASAA